VLLIVTHELILTINASNFNAPKRNFFQFKSSGIATQKAFYASELELVASLYDIICAKLERQGWLETHCFCVFCVR
jgi:hypothetical protein